MDAIYKDKTFIEACEVIIYCWPQYKNPYDLKTRNYISYKYKYNNTFKIFVFDFYFPYILTKDRPQADSDSPTKIYLDDGYYNFCELKETLKKKS